MDDRHPVFDELGDSIRNRVGLQRYNHWLWDPDDSECTLTCSTWAQHVSLVIAPAISLGSAGLDLAPHDVQRLVIQLQEWLDKR